jgi:hypothetical protein
LRYGGLFSWLSTRVHRGRRTQTAEGVEKMDPGEERITGTRDEHYDLIAVLYHALEGADTTESCILDAEAAGDEQLAFFFREAQDTHRHLAKRAKELLGILEVPSEGGISPGGISGGMPPAEEEGRITPGNISGGIPPDDVRAEAGGTPTGDAPPPRAVPPDVPGTENPPPRMGDAPPSPSEEPPSEEHLPRQGP